MKNESRSVVAHGHEWREGWMTKRHQKLLGCDGNILYLDCDNSLTVYATIKTHQTAH